MNFNVMKFLDMLIKAPTLFVYSIFKWGKKIDPHKMFLTCVLQEVLILLFFIVYITTPGYNLFGVFVFIAAFVISLAIDYIFILGMPDDKDYWMYIITGNLTEDLYRRASKSKALSSKLGIEYTKGKKKKPVKEQVIYEDEEEYYDDVTREEYKDEIDYNNTEYLDEYVKSKISIVEDDSDIVEQNDVSMLDDIFNNASVVDEVDEDETSNEGKYETTLEDLASMGEQTAVEENTYVEETKEEVKETKVVEDEISKVTEQMQEFTDNFESKLMDDISRTNKFGNATNSLRINIQMDGYDNNGEEQTMKVDDSDEI